MEAFYTTAASIAAVFYIALVVAFAFLLVEDFPAWAKYLKDYGISKWSKPIPYEIKWTALLIELTVVPIIFPLAILAGFLPDWVGWRVVIILALTCEAMLVPCLLAFPGLITKYGSKGKSEATIKYDQITAGIQEPIGRPNPDGEVREPSQTDFLSPQEGDRSAAS